VGGRCITPTTAGNRLPRVVDNDFMKRLVYSALVAGLSALASIAANRAAAMIWRRAFSEDPPE